MPYRWFEVPASAISCVRKGFGAYEAVLKYSPSQEVVLHSGDKDGVLAELRDSCQPLGVCGWGQICPEVLFTANTRVALVSLGLVRPDDVEDMVDAPIAKPEEYWAWFGDQLDRIGSPLAGVLRPVTILAAIVLVIVGVIYLGPTIKRALPA